MACNGIDGTYFAVYETNMKSEMVYNCIKKGIWKEDSSPITTLRNIFSLSAYDNESPRTETAKCDKEQIFDFSVVKTILLSSCCG